MTILTVIGLVLTVVFGLLNLYQLHLSSLEKTKMQAHRNHLAATARALQATRSMLTEAIESEEAVKSNAVRQLLRAVAYQLVGTEGHIEAAVQDITANVKNPKSTESKHPTE